MRNFQREGVMVEEKIYVAISKEIEENWSILTWALQNTEGKKLCIIHVQQTTKKIPAANGYMPPNTFVEKEVQYSREKEREEISAVLDECLHIFHKSGVLIEILYFEADSIEKGIVQLVEQHNIEKLVIGAAADKHFSRRMAVRSKKAIYVEENSPPFCHIWFVCNGHLIHTRKAESSPCKITPYDPFAPCWSTTSNDSHSSSMFMFGTESEIDLQADNLPRVAFEGTLGLRKAEKEALRDAICKAENAERLYNQELRLRKAKEAELSKRKEEAEIMKNLWKETSHELHKTRGLKFSLERLIVKSNKSLTELEDKLFSAEQSVQKYKNKHEDLQMERNNAVTEVDKLRKQLCQGPSRSYVPVYFSVFSPSDLEKATQNFAESLKIGEGGYGSIYKGFLRQTQVAVKILKPDSRQGRREFDQEVEVLSKLRHPNLVTLVGACPDSSALVYEYLPGGSLEDRLLCKDNVLPLSWQTRIRIVTELCSALIFLHSSRPGCIIHGDLKPANVLLDDNCVCKLSDFGICRVVLNSRISMYQTTLICNTEPKGTIMYMDPEFLLTGELTPKSDVYSFGIILLRLLTGKSALGIAKEVAKALSERNLGSMLDPSAGNWPFIQAEQLAHLAVRCCDRIRQNRPDLRSEVWKVLEPMKASCQSLSILRLASDNQPPNYFMCPISQEIMEDPHIASDGFTYELEAIRGWLDSGHDSSPMTNMTLANLELTPNHALRSAIQEWLQHNQSGLICKAKVMLEFVGWNSDCNVTSIDFNSQTMSFSKGKEMGEFQTEGVKVEEKLYVAVSKEVNECRSILTWALQNSGGKIVCLIHVHQPAKKVSIPEKEVKSFREQGREEMFAVPYEYLHISRKFGVRVEKLYIESDSIEKGIIQLIEQYNIEKLVIGAAADQHYSWKMTEVRSQKAAYVRDNAPPFCHIWFICSGSLIHTREAINPTAASDVPPSRWSTDSFDSSYSRSGSASVGCVSQSSSMFMKGNESQESSISDHPYDRLEREMIEAEKSRQAAFKESMRLLKAEKDALSDAIFKAKTAERLYNEEIKLRKAVEEELAKEYEAIEVMEEIQLKGSLELRKTNADKFSLEKLFEESNDCREELEEKLLSVEEMLKMYKYEHEELETERDNALKEAENLREQLGHIGPSSSNSHVDVPVELADFSCSDLLKATMDFNESLKIGEVGYGSVYKGYLCDTEVTITILNHRSLTNSPQQFDQEVDVLSKLQHPNLVSLVGTCPEICALVYEQLPEGNLEDRLMCKDNAPSLSWQTRIQIAVDVCSVLIFLHSFWPSYIIHGNLKPSNVLLDANCVCKLSNLGTREIDYFDPKGAFVHMDPEVLDTGEATPESDVYSFGIILLRLLTGKSALRILMTKSGLSKGTISSELDPSAGDWPLLQAEQLARMALRCCDVKQNRPDLGSDVWSALESMKASCQSLSVTPLALNNEAPSYFMCPIFQEVMEDPHIASDGFTYEAEAIRGWFDGGHDNSPMTNVTLTNHNLTPNRALRSAIQEWQLHNRVE
ncbi:uncharacterized protein LOC141587372 [Silene latifolia]|uniref:uncharacterized protein LOC141587372 n=1 Tax=Silene latifolia TaxID=37657 RepID=UPI003D76B8B4